MIRTIIMLVSGTLSLNALQLDQPNKIIFLKKKNFGSIMLSPDAHEPAKPVLALLMNNLNNEDYNFLILNGLTTDMKCLIHSMSFFCGKVFTLKWIHGNRFLFKEQKTCKSFRHLLTLTLLAIFSWRIGDLFLKLASL